MMGVTKRETDAEHAVLDDAGKALFRLGRAFGRLPLRELLEPSNARGTELSAILVVQAVAEAERTGREVTIGGLATQLGVDPSTASRLVAQSVQAGLLRRDASQSDARARHVALSEAGRTLAEDAARFQRAVFAAATDGWSEAEREAFARMFVRFADAIVAALHAERTS